MSRLSLLLLLLGVVVLIATPSLADHRGDDPHKGKGTHKPFPGEKPGNGKGEKPPHGGKPPHRHLLTVEVEDTHEPPKGKGEKPPQGHEFPPTKGEKQPPYPGKGKDRPPHENKPPHRRLLGEDVDDSHRPSQRFPGGKPTKDNPQFDQYGPPNGGYRPPHGN